MTNRYFRNKVQDGYLIFEVNDGGVKTEVMRIDGSLGETINNTTQTFQFQFIEQVNGVQILYFGSTGTKSTLYTSP